MSGYNYPEGVTGNEPQITGEEEPEEYSIWDAADDARDDYKENGAWE